MMTRCCCFNCMNPGTVRTTSARRGERAVYMCDFHANRLLGYSTENDFRHGTEKVNPFTYGVELETSFSPRFCRTATCPPLTVRLMWSTKAPSIRE